MKTIRVALSDELRDFVRQQVASRSFVSGSEYVRALLRHERETATLCQLLRNDGKAKRRGKRAVSR